MTELDPTQIAEGGWILLAAYVVFQIRAGLKAAWPSVKAWLEKDKKEGDE